MKASMPMLLSLLTYLRSYFQGIADLNPKVLLFIDISQRSTIYSVLPLFDFTKYIISCVLRLNSSCQLSIQYSLWSMSCCLLRHLSLLSTIPPTVVSFTNVSCWQMFTIILNVALRPVNDLVSSLWSSQDVHESSTDLFLASHSSLKQRPFLLL